MLEGFYVKVGGDIFAVKGVLHPPGMAVAVPVYVKQGGGYRRIRAFRDALRYLEEKMPRRLAWLDYTGQPTPVVPLSEVEETYDPLEFDGSSTDAGRDAVRLKRIIESSAGVEVGVSGSILLGLDTPKSDIDLVIYGVEAGERAYRLLRELRAEGVLKPVKSLDWIVETRRDSATPPEKWLELESRKILTGVFGERLYSLKIVPLPSEYWERLTQRVRCIGRSRLVCRVTGSRLGLATPNLYTVDVLEVLRGTEEAYDASQVMSMRSRFSELARDGDVVEVEGRLEEVTTDGRIIRVFVGNSDEDEFIPRG